MIKMTTTPGGLRRRKIQCSKCRFVKYFVKGMCNERFMHICRLRNMKINIWNVIEL